MFKSFRPDSNDLELIDVVEYTLLKDKNEIKFIIGKTKTNKYLVIQAQYEHNNINDFFQTKLTLNNLKEKSKYFTNALSIDECYVLILNLFQDNNIYVKDIINKNFLKLVHQYNEKNIEINLLYKKNEKNIFLHKSYTHVESNNIDLNIDKVSKIEEIKEEKNSNENEKENTNDNNDINNNKEIKENEEKNNIEFKNEDKSYNDLDYRKEDNIEQNNNIENNDEINKIEKNNNDVNDNDDDNDNNKNEDNQIMSEEKSNIINDDNSINENNKEHNNLNNEDNNKNSNNDINENININLESKEKDDEENNNKNEDKKEENDKGQKILEEDNNKNNNLNNSNIDVNKLLEKIKRLEEENKQLKIENKELKDKLSHINYNEEKLKKSEKEKEKLKIELQKLKNSLNGKIIEENKQKNNISNTNGNQIRQNILPFPKKLDFYNSKQENSKITQKDVPTRLEKEKKNMNIINSNRNNNIEKEKINNLNKINIESKPPINLKIHKTITQSSYILYSLDNCFTAFTSLNNELLLVYATKIKSIECFDLIKQKYHKTILNAHNGQILTIRHYCSKNINKDLIISGSNGDFCVKIWDVETWTCIFNINKIYQKGNMYSICILFDEYQKESFVFTSSDCDYIKIWEFNGKFINNINKTNNNAVYLIDTYYDKQEYKYYLISGEMRCVKSYDLNTYQLFRIYSDNNSFSEHVSAFIYTQGEVAKLVESEFYGSVRIWNFHTGYIIKKIDVCRRIPLVSMCLWNENYLLVSCVDNTIKLIDFKNYALIKSFSGHNNEVCTIKKIIHPTFGECLLSQGLANDQIKLWINS